MGRATIGDAPPGMCPPTLHLVSPTSVSTWFTYFTILTPEDRVVELGEGDSVVLAPVMQAITEGLSGGKRDVVIFSSHETLARDLRLAQALRRKDIAVLAQSPACARLGWDKFSMKAFFDRNAVPTARWARRAQVASLGGANVPIVVKHRRGTQNIGTYLSTVGRCEPGPDEFAELYVDGVEYSVVAYRDRCGVATFPPVWKGRTTSELTPPWRRLRLCPARDTPADLDARLRAMAADVVTAAGAIGHVEVEMVVDETGDLRVFEINPRVSGTMRISAMATEVPIFSLHRLPTARGSLQAVRCAAEVPYSGPPICDPHGAVFGTSRLTVAAPDFAAAQQKLAAVGNGVGARVGEAG